jgi:hypothetical protein
MQHHLIEIFVFGGGVHETRKTVWAFSDAEDGHLASLEGGREAHLPHDILVPLVRVQEIIGRPGLKPD